MRIILTTLFLLASASFVAAQTKNCNCRSGSNSASRFTLSGKTIIICGNKEKKAGHFEYSEFELYQCGKRNAVHGWDATQTCTVKQSADTLIISELYEIPNGIKFRSSYQPFYITKYFFKNNTLSAENSFNDSLRKYTAAEINSVIDAFKSYKEPLNNYDNYLVAVNRLFWAYVSGSKKAENYLMKLKTKYGKYDGAVAEEFDTVIATFELYQKLKQH